MRAPTPEITLQDEFDLPENIDSDNLLEDSTFDSQNESHNDLPKNTDHDLLKSTNQQLSISNTNIGLFKNELEVCLYISQRPELVNLILSMMKASGYEPEIIQEKPVKFSKFSDNVNLILHCLNYYLNIINF